MEISAQKGATEIDKKHISQRQVVHLSRSPQTSDISGMCSTTLRCYFDDKLGQMRAWDDIEFELEPSESEEPRQRKKRREPVAPESAVNLRKPIAPAFLAGDFYCMQNKKMIRVKSPETVYLTVPTLGTDSPRSIIGFHVWDDQVVLITDVVGGVKIFMIDIQTRQVQTRIMELHNVQQSQVAYMVGEEENRLFLFHLGKIVECAKSPTGCEKVTVFQYEPPFSFAQRGKCFCIQQGIICIGFDSFVAFYNFEQIRKDVKPMKHLELQGPVWTSNCYFYVTCNKPSEVIFVSPDSTKQVLVSSAEGVQLWTLPRLEFKARA
jgi:hypothetical protein